MWRDVLGNTQRAESHYTKFAERRLVNAEGGAQGWEREGMIRFWTQSQESSTKHVSISVFDLQ